MLYHAGEKKRPVCVARGVLWLQVYIRYNYKDISTIHLHYFLNYTHFRFLKILWKYCLLSRAYCHTPNILSLSPVSYSRSGTLSSMLQYFYIHSIKASQMFSTVSRTGDIIPHFLYGTDHMHSKVSPFTVNTAPVQKQTEFRALNFICEWICGRREL